MGMKQKKSKITDSKKLRFSTLRTNSQCFFAKISVFGPWVKRIVILSNFDFIRYLQQQILGCSKKRLIKVHIFQEGHKILRNLQITFDWH